LVDGVEVPDTLCRIRYALRVLQQMSKVPDGITGKNSMSERHLI